MAVAAPLGIFLVNQYSFSVFFLSFAGLCICSFLLLWQVKKPETRDITKDKGKCDGNRFIEWKIVIPGLAAFLQMFVYGAVNAFFPLYALQCGVSNPGLFFTASAVVIVIGRAFGGQILDIYNKENLIVALILIMMTSMVILAFSRNLPMFIFVGLLFGSGMAFFLPASMASALEYARSSGGPAVATFNAFFDLGVGIGSVVTGLIIPVTGYPMMFLSLALISFMNLCYFQLFVRKKCMMRPTN
jgi:predicted MFS family arabinose efflux permease